jgi:hypothetical protein
MKKNIALFITITFFTAALQAADFGVLLDQGARVGGIEEAAFDYEANLIPRFSTLLGDSGDLYLSAALTFGYDDGAYFVPELLRSELTWRFGRGAKLMSGRMRYSAPFTALAEGLFDGLQFSYSASLGTLYAGAWYTGLLYKKKANIIISGEDFISYYNGLDYENFADTYFASKRVVAALGWEHPALAELLRTKLGVIAQIDLNGNDNYLHSQYITARIGMPVSQFVFSLGGALEIAENADDNKIGFAGELEASWNLPTAFSSRLSLSWYYASGHAEDEDSPLTAFTPITSQFCGSILQANPSAISTINLVYSARLHQSFSLSVASMYFIRTDLGTFVSYPLDIENSDGYCLGNEFYVNLIWSPVSDLQINLGGGMFVPATGNAAPDRKPQWRVELGAIFTLY